MNPKETTLRIIKPEPPKLEDEDLCPDCGKPYGIDPDSCACPLEFEVWE